MTKKIVYKSNMSPLENCTKLEQFFEIEQVPGKIKGLREFRFHNLYQCPNGEVFNNIANLNVAHLKNLLELLRRMDTEGFLDNEYVTDANN